MPLRSLGLPPQRWLADAERIDATKGGWQTDNPFGRAQNPAWKTPQNQAERAAITAAQHQHELVKQIRLRMERSQKRTKDLARDIGLSVPTLRSILSGATHVNLTDLHRIAVALDLTFGGRFSDPTR